MCLLHALLSHHCAKLVLVFLVGLFCFLSTVKYAEMVMKKNLGKFLSVEMSVHMTLFQCCLLS